MKLRITHLKAPWPQGAKVGDVVDLPEVPAWALGKCVHVEDEAEPATEPAFVANVPPVVEPEPEPVAAPAVEPAKPAPAKGKTKG